MFKQIKAISLSFFRKKSQSFGLSNFFGLFSSEFGLNNKEIKPKEAIIYYSLIPPLYDAVNRLSTEFGSNIGRSIWDKTKKEFIYDSDFLELLENPNTDKSGDEFLEELAQHYLITGNAFLMATGDIDKPPLELFLLNPDLVEFVYNEQDGLVEVIKVRQADSHSHYLEFFRDESKRPFRFISRSKKQELFHIRKSNPRYLYGWGQTPVSALYKELQQYIGATEYNLANLRFSGNAGGIFKFPDGTDKDVVDRYKSEVRSYYEGGSNAGRAIFLEGGMDFTAQSSGMKDADFQTLRTWVATQIYNIYKIPLPLIMTGTMTMNNLDIAKYQLYDNAVLPLANRLFKDLTVFLMPRYYADQWKNFDLTYDASEITALQPRRIQDLKATKEIGINSINELRAMQGSPAVVGGNSIYQNGGNVPVARVIGEDEQKALEILSQFKFADGTSVFKSLCLPTQKEKDASNLLPI